MLSTCFWQQFPQQKYLFCERQLCGLIVAPADTWSNIGYLIAAIAIMRSRDHITREVRNFFSWSLIALFVCSTAFHGTGTIWGKLADVSSMLVISAGVLSLALKRCFQLSPLKTNTIFALLLVPSLWYLFAYRLGAVIFMLQLVMAIFIEMKVSKDDDNRLEYKWLRRAATTFAVAFIIWILEVKRILCWPDNHVLTGHGVWHLLTAASLWMLYKAYTKDQEFAGLPSH